MSQEGLFAVSVASLLANSNVPTVTKTPNSNKEWKNIEVPRKIIAPEMKDDYDEWGKVKGSIMAVRILK